MGFEQIVPPIPTRDHEIRAIEKLQKSWLSQAYYQYFMNENIRTVKLQRYYQYDILNLQFFGNFLLGFVILLPITFGMRRFFVIGANNLPMLPKFTSFIRRRSALQHRQYYYLKWSFFFSLFGSLAVASALTNTERVKDDYLDKSTKSPLMM